MQNASREKGGHEVAGHRGASVGKWVVVGLQGDQSVSQSSKELYNLWIPAPFCLSFILGSTSSTLAIFPCTSQESLPSPRRGVGAQNIRNDARRGLLRTVLLKCRGELCEPSSSHPTSTRCRRVEKQEKQCTEAKPWGLEAHGRDEPLARATRWQSQITSEFPTQSPNGQKALQLEQC